MTPDTTALRALIRARRAAGWQHIVYGPRDHRDHIWRSQPKRSHDSKALRPARVTFYERDLEYFKPGSSKAAATIRPYDIDEVVGFLVLVGLLDGQAEVRRQLLGDRLVRS